MLAATVLGDAQARHILHNQIRLTFGGGTSVKNLGDGRVIHDCQGLPFQIESQQGRAIVAARFEDFQRNLPFDGRRLFGQPNLPHPAFAQSPDQTVRPYRA
jgi:hypothetical protein